MTILDFQFSGAGLLEAIIAAAIIFFLLRIARRAGTFLLPQGTYRLAFQRTFPVVESLTWILFTVWALGLIFTDRMSQSLAPLTFLAVSVIWLAWFAARDFIAGLILRLQDDYEVGLFVRLDNIEGSISKVGLLGIDIGRTDGAVTRIPYSKITGAVHSRRPPEAASRHVFQIQVPKRASLTDTINRVRTSALTSAWTSPEDEPRVRAVSETSHDYILEVAVSGIGAGHFDAIERDVRSQLNIEASP